MNSNYSKFDNTLKCVKQQNKDVTDNVGTNIEIKEFVNPGYETVKPINLSVNLLEDVQGKTFDKSDDEENPVQSARDFFLEHNGNFTISWDEANEYISHSGDPSCPPVQGWNISFVRWKIRRFIESIFFRVFSMIIIFIDLVIIIFDIAHNHSDMVSKHMREADLIITIYFVIELCFRIFSLKFGIFFSIWYNALDFAVVMVSLIAAITTLITNDVVSNYITLFSVLRFVRVIRIINLFILKKHFEKAFRQLISQNKRRYQQDGFDLDLTYITKRIIATSFPSSGLTSLFRNPIRHVAHFLDSKHGGHYKIYNLCSERSYDTDFFHNRVECFPIDDHNVPSLEDMNRFVTSVKSWYQEDPQNIIVVHCKGGKGRTGTLICVLLIEFGLFESAEKSLKYFGDRRTDTNVASKFQGVETPSQSRYVSYYEMSRNGSVPTSQNLVIRIINIRGIGHFGRGNGTDIYFIVYQGTNAEKKMVFSANLEGEPKPINCSFSIQDDTLAIVPINFPVLVGDVCIQFYSTSSIVPTGYEKCAFYFWFNTAFINERKLTLTRHDLDNPHKERTWFCYRENFQVEITFE